MRKFELFLPGTYDFRILLPGFRACYDRCSLMGRISSLARVVLGGPSRPSECFSALTKAEGYNGSTFSGGSCIAAVQSCAEQKDLIRGKVFHCYMLRNGFVESPTSVTSLINMYSKCSQLNCAEVVFRTSVPECNVYTYNAIIAGLTANGQAESGLEYYEEMRAASIVPDKFTFPCVIKGCSDVMEVVEVRKIHGLLFKLGLDLDVFIGSSLVNCYLKLGLMDEAEEVLRGLTTRDVVIWNAMINGYAQTFQFDKALEAFRKVVVVGIVPSQFMITGMLSVFAEMRKIENGKSIHGFILKMGYDSGVAISNALIDIYGKCGSLEDAYRIFEDLEEKDIYSWNSILSVRYLSSEYESTLRLFNRMLRAGLLPDLVTVTVVLPACSNSAALVCGREIHGFMVASGMDDTISYSGFDETLVRNAIMDMYAKCGNLMDALSVFKSMVSKDVASWNIMIMGYGMQGYSSKAVAFFKMMCQSKIKPDEASFVAVLSACSHAGYVDQGREFLAQMELEYGVTPTTKHYGCVVDMLGRANRIEEAYEVALTMPVEANPVIWRALLSACHLHGNTRIAQLASRKVAELDPTHCGGYVLISNACIASGRYEEVVDVRRMMRERNVRKFPGSSCM